MIAKPSQRNRLMQKSKAETCIRRKNGSEQESVGPPWFCRASEKKLISVDSAG